MTTAVEPVGPLTMTTARERHCRGVLAHEQANTGSPAYRESVRAILDELDTLRRLVVPDATVEVGGPALPAFIPDAEDFRGRKGVAAEVDVSEEYVMLWPGRLGHRRGLVDPVGVRYLDRAGALALAAWLRQASERLP